MSDKERLKLEKKARIEQRLDALAAGKKRKAADLTHSPIDDQERNSKHHDKPSTDASKQADEFLASILMNK